MGLRRIVLTTVPHAAEAVKFGCLCYYRAGAPFGAIGGNICMIEVRHGKVMLSFIHGASLPESRSAKVLLQGRGKAKRFIPIATIDSAADTRVAELLRAAAKLRPSSTPDQHGAARSEL